MNFLDLCAGIGGFRLGMEQAGNRCVGYVEIDKFARKSYEAMYDTRGEWTAHDITTVTDEEIRAIGRDVQLICGGFPCQAFSIAGKRRGFDDPRGVIIFHFWRFVREIRPKWLVFENVKGLLSHNRGGTFRTIVSAFAELGYRVEWQVLNSKYFGVPQNRERIYIIGHFGEGCARKVFPVSGDAEEDPCKLREITSGAPDSYRVYDPSGIARTLKSEGGGLGAKTGLYAVTVGAHGVGVDRAYNVKASVTDAPVMDRMRIRRLTPRECWRLQGFPDELFDRARAAGLSDLQLYRQAGNAVTVNVVAAIGRKIWSIDREEK